MLKETQFLSSVPDADFTLSSPGSLFATFISENIYNKLRAFIIEYNIYLGQNNECFSDTQGGRSTKSWLPY